MKQKLLLIVLAVGVFTIYAHSQTDVLRTEKDGFQWFKNYDIDGSVGASSKDGNIIISTKSGYNLICYHPQKHNASYFEVWHNKKKGVCDKTGKVIIAPDKFDWIFFVEIKDHVGYYQVEKNGILGACDLSGKEIIPCKYKEIYYLNNKFQCKTSTGKYLYKNVKLDKQGYLVEKKENIANNKTQKKSKTDNPDTITVFDIFDAILPNDPHTQKKDVKSKTSQTYDDSKVFGFKGKVKKCMWTYQVSPLNNYPWPYKEILFSANGEIIIDGYEIERDSNGRLLKIERGITTFNFTYDSNNRINCIEHVVFNPFGDNKVEKYYYNYDSEGRIISSNYEHYILGRITYVYNRFTNDTKGNWIECHDTKTYIKNSNKENYNPKREIEYY